MKIKPYITLEAKRYYKLYYNKNDYDIVYATENKWVCLIACKLYNESIIKCKIEKWETIEAWLNRSNKYRYSIENITKEDVFLELL